MGLPMLRQPQGIIRLRPEFARFKGVGAVLGASTEDIFGSGARITYQNGPAQSASAHGLARRFETAKSTYALIPPPAGVVDFSLAQPFMIVCAFTLAVPNVATRILSYRQAAASSSNWIGIHLGFTTNGRLGFWLGNATGQGAQVAGNTAMVAHRPYTVAVGWDGSAYFMFINGVRQSGSSPASFATSNNATTTDINIGRRNTGSSYLDGTVSMFAHMTGPFALEEARLLSANPWAMFDDVDAYDERIVPASAPVSPLNLVGAAGVQGNQAGTATINQVQNLSAAPGAQANAGGAGALGQVQSLAGAAGEVASAGGVEAVGQTQNLVGAPGTQQNTGEVGQVAMEAPGVLDGAEGEQINAGPGGAIGQVQALAGSGGDQPNIGSNDAAGQVHNLIGAASVQQNTGAVAAITVAAPEELDGAAGEQINAGTDGAIGQSAVLTAAEGVQRNTGDVGALARLGLAIIYVDPGELRIYAERGERRVWPIAAEQRILTLH